MRSGPAAALADTLTVLRGDGPVILHARRWPRDLHALFPGVGRPLERWVGEGAAFARFNAGGEPLFLKFIPAGWRDRRAWERLAREAAYLRDLAPLSPVPHAPFRHAAQSERTPHAHLLTRDLTEETTGWGRLRMTRRAARPCWKSRGCWRGTTRSGRVRDRRRCAARGRGSRSGCLSAPPGCTPS
ncbi:hypothetical protein [Deinococcus aquaticus]|uniref:hypothetical protein n=1 Tax=Deinococcus aquaticus TaxID=328692 RepID=UPI0036103096